MAEGGASGYIGRGTARYLCGVPKENCSGSVANLSNSFKNKGYRIHNSSGEAMKCMQRHLITLGYTKLGPREFQPPGGGPIRVLTKQIRFGAKMRPGKGGRNMPSNPRTGGTAVSA